MNNNAGEYHRKQSVAKSSEIGNSQMNGKNETMEYFFSLFCCMIGWVDSCWLVSTFTFVSITSVLTFRSFLVYHRF